MIEIENIYASYERKNSIINKEKVNVLKNISLQVKKGESIGIVGESGSGKSTLAKAIVGLKSMDSGRILFEDKEIFNINDKRFNNYNRKDIQMIFQDPYSSLNPKLKVKKIIGETILYHKLAQREDLEESVINTLKWVNLDETFLNRFPDQLSGGQRQRVNIARALAAEPKLLICDEPTSALDLLIQKDILNLIINLKRNMDLTYIFISHDLEVVRYVCNRVFIMYDGEIIEEGNVEEIFQNPKQEYTKRLMDSIPKIHPLE